MVQVQQLCGTLTCCPCSPPLAVLMTTVRNVTLVTCWWIQFMELVAGVVYVCGLRSTWVAGIFGSPLWHSLRINRALPFDSECISLLHRTSLLLDTNVLLYCFVSIFARYCHHPYAPHAQPISVKNEMGWACGAYGWGGGVYRVLVGKPDGKRPMGRPRRRWVDNIRTDLQEMECGYMDWIGLA